MREREFLEYKDLISGRCNIIKSYLLNNWFRIYIKYKRN